MLLVLSLAFLASEVEAQNTRLIGELGRNRSPQAVAALLKSFPCDPLWVSKALEDSKNVISRGRVILKTDSCQSAPPPDVAARSKQMLNPPAVRRVSVPSPKPVESLAPKVAELEKKLSEKEAGDAQVKARISSLESAERARTLPAVQLPEAPRPNRVGAWFRARWEAIKSRSTAIVVVLLVLAAIAVVITRVRKRNRDPLPASVRMETRKETTLKT